MSGFFGVVLIYLEYITELTNHFIGIYAFGVFCILISTACFTVGVARRTIGRVIGAIVFSLSILYLYSQLVEGVIFSARQSQSSIFNAILFMVALGFPGLYYTIYAKFPAIRTNKTECHPDDNSDAAESLIDQGYMFKSDLFQIQKEEDKETNPGCYGKELGEWLCLKFKELGYNVEDLIPEDWGWCVMCEREEYLLWVGCGPMQEYFEDYDPELPPKGEDVIWHVFPEIEVPFFYFKSLSKKWRGKLDIEKPLQKLDQDLKMILNSEPRITLCE